MKRFEAERARGITVRGNVNRNRFASVPAAIVVSMKNLNRIQKRRSLVLVALFSLLLACSSSEKELVRISGTVMGTTYNVSLLMPEASELSLNDVKLGVQKSLDQVDRLMSTYKPDSDISRFNSALAGSDVSVSPLTAEVYREALFLNQETLGAFDATVSPLVRLWGFGADGELVSPSTAKIQQAKSLVGHDKLTLVEGQHDSSVNGAVLRKLKDVQLDFSAIAKGKGVDRVAEYLLDFGIENFLVEVGGEIRVSGSKTENTPWILGIEVPLLSERQAQAMVSIGDRALATSGDYRNYREVEGERVSHIIDPVSGLPVKHRLASVSVVAKNCSTADGLATALMVLGDQKGYQLAKAQALDAYFIVRTETGFETRYTGRFGEYLK